MLAIGVGGLLGYALTMLFRSTVATLSLMFGVAIAGSLIVVAILGDDAARWLLPTNFLAFVLGGFSYYDASACTYSSDGMVSGNCETTLAAVDGGIVLAVIVVVSVGAVRVGDPPSRRALSGLPDDRELGAPAPRRRVRRVTAAPAPEGRKLLRPEIRNAETPSNASRSGSRPRPRWARSTPRCRAW